MTLFRNKKRREIRAWPAELERRRPENGELRDQLERGHRALLAQEAKRAAEQVVELQPKVDRLEDIAQWIEIDRRPKEC